MEQKCPWKLKDPYEIANEEPKIILCWIGEPCLHFTLSRCNSLICQIFTHEQFYCPLWATVGKLCLFQWIPGKKKLSMVLVRKQQPEVAGEKKHSCNRQQTKWVHSRCCIKKKKTTYIKNSTVEQWERGTPSPIWLFDSLCCETKVFDISHYINIQLKLQNKKHTFQHTLKTLWTAVYQFLCHCVCTQLK